MKNKRANLICSVVECGKPATCKGFCNTHYQRHLRATRNDEINAKRRASLKEKAVNPCGCGCGGLTAFNFIHGHHTRLFTSAEQSRRGRMCTGDKTRDTGEGKSYRKLHSRHEHRRVAEAMIGRPLTRHDVVHHKNGNKRDNRPDNLEVMTRSEHIALHRQDLIDGRKKKI